MYFILMTRHDYRITSLKNDAMPIRKVSRKVMQLLLRLMCSMLVLWSFSASAEESQSTTPKPVNAWGAAADAETAQAAAEKDQFDILEYVVNGNSVLTVTEIEKAVYPFLGEHRSIADVENARTALEKSFHDAGYLTVFVTIPEQEVNAGVVQLEVLEGKVERLNVVGSKYYSLGKIKQRVTEFKEGNVPHFPTVQKQIATVNINSDRVVAPVLRPGKSPGMVEVDLKVDDKLPLHASMELNDRYSPNTTKTRLSGNLRYDNLWQRDHSFSFGFQVTPEKTDEVKVLSATYVIPYAGDYFATYAVVSDSNISAVGDLNVIGKGNILGLRYIHPMPSPVKSYNHNLTLGVDYKDFKQNTITQGSDTDSNPITYLPFLIGYTGNLVTPESTTKLDLNLNFATKALVNDENQFATRRSFAHANYSFLRGQLEHTYTLPRQWQWYGSIGGQATSDHLISNEQYFLGGLDTVRGFMESSALGDVGVNFTTELRTPPLQKYAGSWVKDLRVLAFYDYGLARTWDPDVNHKDPNELDNLYSTIERYIVSSYGLGLDMKGERGLFMRLDFATVLQSNWIIHNGHIAPSKPAGIAESGDTRLHFRVGFDW